MATCSHHDNSRKTVGVTALGVAALRAIETAKGETALINDPFASTLATEDGYKWVEELNIKKPEVAASMVDGLAIRTKKIDDEIVQYIQNGGIQVCVPGAGLDCRPWRIQHSFDKTDPNLLDQVFWYELDFPEMLDHKLNSISTVSSGNCSCKAYLPVKADLSLPTWDSVLSDSGYDSSLPTAWLLEGFTSYLTEAELTSFLTKVSEISCKGSIIIATFIAPGTTSTHMKNSLHRAYYDDAPGFLGGFGWQTKESTGLNEIGTSYGRTPSHLKTWESYTIVIAEKQ